LHKELTGYGGGRERGREKKKMSNMNELCHNTGRWREIGRYA